MIDLRPRFEEAVRRIRNWRNRYSPQEYPHKVVINMMYRGYTMDYLWNFFKAGRLPRFTSNNEMFNGMDELYSDIAGKYVHSNLINWLQNDPTKK